ncbi:DUF3048 domain-containing protein [Candidatus Saccharibacteria bacterium]|nr:DUF3048 domain-containing protein [Candidatus Saccharibacteria bacterium]
MKNEKTAKNSKTIEISDNPKPAEKKPEKSKKPQKPNKSNKKLIIICIFIAIFVAGGVTGLMILLNKKSGSGPTSTNSGSQTPEIQRYYSNLSGLEIPDEKLNDSPIFCIQVPNGTDGARPHVGLQEASIVYEAIAEAGITRFAAVFQNPKNTVIGPIRSLRLYYLEWDTPLGCTVVHAGGADDAIAALRSGGYNEIDEGAYNWRDGYDYIAPNNLFTDAKNLSDFAKEYGLEDSGKNAKAYPRLLPTEAIEIQAKNIEAAKDTTDTEGKVVKSTTPLVSEISINFGNFPDFNTHYSYNPQSGSYARSYESGEKEISYVCSKENPIISRDCREEQIAPSAVVAMEVEESLADDNYHQVIQAIGEGIAYIFQNGEAHKGTWSKASAASQIIFKDENGKEVSFTPGMLWISAIPRGIGSVEYK